MRQDLHRRLVALDAADRVLVWDLVNAAHPRPEGAVWWDWLHEQLDSAIAAVQNGARARERAPGETWPTPCPGTGLQPSTITAVDRQYPLRESGQMRVLAGRGTCSECGKDSAFTARQGVRRHGRKASAAA